MLCKFSTLWKSVVLLLLLPATVFAVTIHKKDGAKIETIIYTEGPGKYYYFDNRYNRAYLSEGDYCSGNSCPEEFRKQTTTKKPSKTSANPKKVADTPKSATKPQPSTNTPQFGIYGSNTIGAELMPRLISAYAIANGAKTSTTKGIKAEESTINVLKGDQSVFSISLKSHGSGTSFPALAENLAEIGMASRPIKDRETIMLREQGINDMRTAGQEHVLALDGLIVIVAKDNPIKQLSLKQIAKLFSGDIDNWSQVGGPDRPVNLYARDNKSGTYDTFKGLVLKPEYLSLSSKAMRFESNEALSDAVATDPGGIGFTGFAYLRNAKALSLISNCNMVSQPTIFNVKTEEYPLSRRLYLYTTGKKISDHAQKLLDYSLSDAAQPVISVTGFINQSAELASFSQLHKNYSLPATNIEKKLAKQQLALLETAERLSTTFRFNTGSSELDVKGKQDIKRIANLFSEANSEYANNTIYLVGYADSVGDFSRNERLSKNRANQVYRLLEKQLPNRVKNRIKVTGFGELTPIACNTDKVGRSKNRRVEIWIR